MEPSSTLTVTLEDRLTFEHTLTGGWIHQNPPGDKRGGCTACQSLRRAVFSLDSLRFLCFPERNKFQWPTHVQGRSASSRETMAAVVPSTIRGLTEA